ncbi:MAG TPA: GNAT family N-acetyltransferase [Dehalococcoidales bacterium]
MEIEIKHVLNREVYSPSTLSLIKACIGNPTAEKVQGVLREYFQGKGTLYAALANGREIGIIGIEESSARYCTIKHIAVAEEYRRQGIGRQLISSIQKMTTCESMVAETDADAIVFYKKLGFNIHSLGEKHPGTERFRCLLKIAGSKCEPKDEKGELI